MKTLERSKPAKETAAIPARARCITPFNEKNGDCRSWLGNPRWDRIPAFPTRERIWECVRPVERNEAARILTAYRENEAICRANDVVSLTQRATQLEASRDAEEIVKARTVREEIANCNHTAFLAAQAETRRLIDFATTELVIPVLERCIESFDTELSDLAIERESDMSRLGLPLFREIMPGSTKLYINGKFDGQMDRVWELWSSPECNCLHSCREICRNLLQKFTIGEGEHVAQSETRRDRSIPTLIYLFTDEDVPRFSWL